MKNIFSLSIPINLGQKKPGVSKGPEDIYNSYLKYKFQEFELEHQIFEHKSQNIDEILYELQKYIREIIHKNDTINKSESVDKYDFFIFLGGDHSISMGTISGMFLNHPREKCVIWLDAHTDCNNIRESKSGNIHGMPVAGLLGDLEEPYDKFKCLNYDEICYVGTRSIDDYEKKYIDKNNIINLGIDKINSNMDLVLEKIDKFIDNREVHISFDIDIMDPSLLSSTGVPEDDGVNMDQMIKILSFLKNYNIKSMDIVEFNPELGDPIETKKNLFNLLNYLI